jgi:large subunit ribosomal protein L4
MPEITVHDWNKRAVRTLELDAAVFEYPLKKHLIYEAVLAYRAAGRSGTHKAKNRVEVSGGTRKLWRQKGTGRARVGDNRSPLWRHGGTIHGPRPRDHSWSFPKRMRRNALRSVLAQALREERVLCLEHLRPASHRTGELDQALRGTLGLAGKTLLVPLEEERELQLAARNNPRLKTVRALGLSVPDVLEYETLVFSADALERLGEVLAR